MKIRNVISRVALSALIGIVMAGVGWIALVPLNSFFGDHLRLGMTFILVNYPGFVIAVKISGAHSPPVPDVCIGIFLEWTAISYVAAWAIGRANRHAVEQWGK